MPVKGNLLLEEPKNSPLSVLDVWRKPYDKNEGLLPGIDKFKNFDAKPASFSSTDSHKQNVKELVITKSGIQVKIEAIAKRTAKNREKRRKRSKNEYGKESRKLSSDEELEKVLRKTNTYTTLLRQPFKVSLKENKDKQKTDRRDFKCQRKESLRNVVGSENFTIARAATSELVKWNTNRKNFIETCQVDKEDIINELAYLNSELLKANNEKSRSLMETGKTARTEWDQSTKINGQERSQKRVCIHCRTERMAKLKRLTVSQLQKLDISGDNREENYLSSEEKSGVSWLRHANLELENKTSGRYFLVGNLKESTGLWRYDDRGDEIIARKTGEHWERVGSDVSNDFPVSPRLSKIKIKYNNLEGRVMSSMAKLYSSDKLGSANLTLVRGMEGGGLKSKRREHDMSKFGSFERVLGEQPSVHYFINSEDMETVDKSDETIQHILDSLNDNNHEIVWRDVCKVIQNYLGVDCVILEEAGEICVEVEQDLNKPRKGFKRKNLVVKGRYSKKEKVGLDVEVELELTTDELEQIIRRRKRKMKEKNKQVELAGNSNKVDQQVRILYEK